MNDNIGSLVQIESERNAKDLLVDYGIEETPLLLKAMTHAVTRGRLIEVNESLAATRARLSIPVQSPRIHCAGILGRLFGHSFQRWEDGSFVCQRCATEAQRAPAIAERPSPASASHRRGLSE